MSVVTQQLVKQRLITVIRSTDVSQS